jgi:hypothetical protein
MIRPNAPRFRLNTDHVAAIAVTLGPIFYFLPALLNHLKLAPDDGRLFNAPLRVATAQIIRSGSLPLWNPYIFGGMPLFASAQGGLLFPPNWFYLIFSPAVATNLMVLSTYMIAALGAYLFARRAGTSIAGAAVTSITWQAGGFLLAQISHINIVHTAAILPWVFWSLERYVASGSRARGAVLALVIAIQVFAGHQQTFAYGLLLVVAYTLVMALEKTEYRNRYLKSLAFTGAGLLLAAVQILPTAELLRNSLRSTATYDFFSSFSMPRSFVTTLIAPFVLGGGDGRLFRAPYIDQLFYTEYIAYAGLLTIMLALLALLLKPDRRTRFWAAAAVVAFILALGSNAPLQLNRLVYFVPVLNLFRVPARHLLEFNFALAVLAGRGLTVLEAQRREQKASIRVAIVSGVVVLLTILTVTLFRSSNFQLARQAPVTILRAPELFMPIVLVLLSAFALWVYWRNSRGALALLITVLAFDLLMWGQFSGWYAASKGIPKEFWGVPESVSLLREKAHDLSGYRILTTHHQFEPDSPVASGPPQGWTLWTEPDVYMMHGIQNAAGYDGFGLQRYSELAGEMKLWGELTDPNATLRSDSREIDLLNVRYLVARREGANELEATSDDTNRSGQAFEPAKQKYGDYLFAPTDLVLPSLRDAERLIIKLPAIEANRVALVTNLSFAEDIPDKTIVARLYLRSVDGREFELPLRAGIDTSDWAFDRPDIRKRIRHARAVVAASSEVVDQQSKYQQHTYVTALELPEKIAVASGYLELDQRAKSFDYSLRVFRVSFIDGDKTYALSGAMVRTSAKTSVESEPKDERWTLLAEGEKVRIFENTRTLPRAWMVSDSRVLNDEAMLKTIRSGVLPDGSKWDPAQTALIQSELPKALPQTSTGSTAKIISYEPNRIELSTQAKNDSLLILSENYYPGWYAYVDGQKVEVLQVNYAQRGVIVPGGEHRVRFVYRPCSVIIGFSISLLTGVALIVCCRPKKLKHKGTS